VEVCCHVPYSEYAPKSKNKISPGAFALSEDHLRHLYSISRPKFYESKPIRALEMEDQMEMSVSNYAVLWKVKEEVV
jgi:hypothetical protein